MISVIIPAYNEEAHIAATIRAVRTADTGGLVKEIIVADGGSADATLTVASAEGAKAVLCPAKGRSAQMNYGALLAKQDVLYFLHADTVPPQNFSGRIRQTIEEGAGAGCFTMTFDWNHWFLKTNGWFSRFNVDAFRYGDQSLFVKKEQFQRVGGFCEKHVIFEDYKIIKGLKKGAPFSIVKGPVITSARKYRENGPFRMQGIFYLMYFLYRFGCSQAKLVAVYKKLIRQDKI